jgi:hypothetical protein
MNKSNKKLFIYIGSVVFILLIGLSIWLLAKNNTKESKTLVAEQCSIVSISDIKSALGSLADNIENGVEGSAEKGTSDQTQKFCDYKFGEVAGTALKFTVRLRDFEAKYTAKGHYDLVEQGISVDRSTKLGDGTTFTQFESSKITNSVFTVYKFETSSRAFEFDLDTQTDGAVKPAEVKALLVKVATPINFDNHLNQD